MALSLESDEEIGLRQQRRRSPNLGGRNGRRPAEDTHGKRKRRRTAIQRWRSEDKPPPGTTQRRWGMKVEIMPQLWSTQKKPRSTPRRSAATESSVWAVAPEEDGIDDVFVVEGVDIECRFEFQHFSGATRHANGGRARDSGARTSGGLRGAASRSRRRPWRTMRQRLMAREA
jgi:hypothetical protein